MIATKKGKSTNGNGVDHEEPAKKGSVLEEKLTINAPNMRVLPLKIRGTAPYVQHKFSAKAQAQIRAKQAEGSVAGKGKKRDARDFAAEFDGCMHTSVAGWHGIPAGAFRAALVSACRTVGFKMTLAKLSLFVVADGFDSDGTPLVKLTKGKPRQVEHPVRLDSGVVSLAVRAMWDEGWEAELRIKFDADQFSATDVANLLMRVGEQVGVGEGRADSRDSTGMGWGSFEIVS